MNLEPPRSKIAENADRRAPYGVALFLLIWMPLQDLTLAWLYAVTGSESIAGLSWVRNAVSLGVAGWAVANIRLPERLHNPIFLYGGLTLLYSLKGLADGIPFGLVGASAATVLLPPMFVVVGYATHRTWNELRTSLYVLSTIAIASSVFGAWDVENTDFWTDTVKLGDYLYNIKGVLVGYDVDTLLPWNFFGFEHSRRAGGLLAAPLAQGCFCAIMAVIVPAVLFRRGFVWAAGSAAIMLVGLLESGTRGGVLIFMIACGAYLMASRAVSFGVKTAIITLLVVAVGSKIQTIIYYSVNLLDGSTIGHLNAFQANISDLGSVALVGVGVGAAGAVRAAADQPIAGGGEGAIFSIAYQLGVPGALVFLWMYFRMGMQLWIARHLPHPLGPLALAFACLFIGITSSFVLSDNALTFSGMGTFWLATGAMLRLIETAPAKASAT